MIDASAADDAHCIMTVLYVRVTTELRVETHPPERSTKAMPLVGVAVSDARFLVMLTTDPFPTVNPDEKAIDDELYPPKELEAVKLFSEIVMVVLYGGEPANHNDVSLNTDVETLIRMPLRSAALLAVVKPLNDSDDPLANVQSLISMTIGNVMPVQSIDKLEPDTNVHPLTRIEEPSATTSEVVTVLDVKTYCE